MTTPILPQPTIETDIRFVRETRDYDCFLVIDGQREYIGSRTRRDDAEAFCNVERLRLLDHIPFIPTEYDLLPEEADDLAPVLADLHADATTPDAAPVAWDKRNDPIAILDDGRTIYGTYDTDATPLFVRYDGPEGYLYAEEDGGIGGVWGGCDLDMTAEQVDALYALFQTGLLKQMQTIGALWLKDAPEHPSAQRYQPDPHLLHTITPCGPLAVMLDGPPTTPLAPAAVPTTPLHDPAEEGGEGGEIIPFADLHPDGECAFRTTLGRIAGMPVRAVYGPTTGLLQATIETPHGCISTDGTTFLNLPFPECDGMVGDIPLTVWMYVQELTQAGHLDALIALARQYPTLPPVEGPEPFVPLADMEPVESGLRRGTLGYVGFVPMIAEYEGDTLLRVVLDVRGAGVSLSAAADALTTALTQAA